MPGADVIMFWAYGLARDTGAILLNVNLDRRTTEGVRAAIDANGGRLTDLHVWRLRPGRFGTLVLVATAGGRNARFRCERLTRSHSLSHLTSEVEQQRQAKRCESIQLQ